MAAMMRKLSVVAMTVAVSTLLFAAPALAGSEVTPPSHGGGGVTEVEGEVTEVEGEVGPVLGQVVEEQEVEEQEEVAGEPVVTPPSELSFTGASITLWMVLVAALVIGGVALLIVGHRRQAGAAQ